MSEIDKPASQPAGNDPSEASAPSSPVAPVWPSRAEPAGADWTAPSAAAAKPAETPPAAESGQPQYVTSVRAETSATAEPVSGAAYPSADGTAAQPGSGGPYVPAGQPVPGSGYTPGQAPVPGYPSSGVPAGGYGPESYPASGVPAGGYPGGPNQSPVWTPPASKKRVPTAVKVVATITAAGVLSLCSGVAGALIATAIDRNGGITLPVSTDTAPVINENSVAGVAAKIQPSVVSIGTGSGEGSGVILTEDGYILTNNHVVESARGGAVTVTLATGKKIPAKVIGTDPKTDLAVVKADTTGLTAATLADSGKVNVGDTVLAVGSPLGLQGSVTKGIISAKDRTIRAGENGTSLSGLLQTDAPINPGNSGGALVDMNGNVIGINTAIATSGSGEGNIGVGFAIPSTKAKAVAEQLMKGGKVSHPFLGVSVTAEETGGAKISAISPNSPAAEAGLQEGDVITKFGDKIVNDSDDLVSAVQSGTVGQKVTVEFTRNGEQKTATVTLKEAS